MKSDYTGYYKIGVSKNTQRRVKQLQTGSSENIEIIYLFKSEYPFKLEMALHNHFNMYKINREWYNLPLEDHLNFMALCEKIEGNLKLVFENNGNNF